jgi:hypothetical protein
MISNSPALPSLIAVMLSVVVLRTCGRPNIG